MTNSIYEKVIVVNAAITYMGSFTLPHAWCVSNMGVCMVVLPPVGPGEQGGGGGIWVLNALPLPKVEWKW